MNFCMIPINVKEQKLVPVSPKTSAPGAALVVSGRYDSDKDRRSGGSRGEPRLRYLS